MKSQLICACLLAGVLAGCAATAGQAAGSQATAGRMAGRMVMEGGPMGPGGQQPGERPISGTVTITAPGHQPVTVTVGSSGAFSVPRPAGRYQVSGRSPAIMTVDGGRSQEEPCSAPISAAVTAGHTVTVTLACIVP